MCPIDDGGGGGGGGGGGFFLLLPLLPQSRGFYRLGLYLFGMSHGAGVIGSDLGAHEAHTTLVVSAVKCVVSRNVDGQAKRMQQIGIQMLAGGDVTALRRLAIRCMLYTYRRQLRFKKIALIVAIS